MWSIYESMGKGYLSSIKGLQKACLFYQNGIQKSKRLDFGVESFRIKLCRVHPCGPVYVSSLRSPFVVVVVFFVA